MKTKKLRVLLMSPLPPPAGGIASWTEQLMRYAECENDVQVDLIDTSVSWRAVTDNSIPKRIFGGSIQAIRNAGQLWRLLLKLKPDIVHICTSGGLSIFKDILFLILCRLRNISALIHFHTGRLPVSAHTGGLLWRLISITVCCATTTIVLDQVSEEILSVKFPIRQILKLPNFIELSGYAYHPPRDIRQISGGMNITFVGHVVPSKGVAELVQACSELHGYKPVLNLFGPYEVRFAESLRKIASDSGVDIRLHGQVDRIKARTVLQDADIVVLPSYTEGFPIVILEAMDAGKPIIATRVGAIPEMLEEYSEAPCGLLINPRNISELKIALRQLSENRELAAYLSLNAYRRAFEEYRTEVVFEKYMKVWKELSD